VFFVIADRLAAEASAGLIGPVCLDGREHIEGDISSVRHMTSWERRSYALGR
jgi:hypothetical protein